MIAANALVAFFFALALLVSANAQDVSVTDAVLDKFLSTLFVEDDQKPLPEEIVVNFQSPAPEKGDQSDMARDRLFTYVSPRLLDKPLYKKFMALFDNYKSETGYNEVETQDETREIDSFLDEVLQTTVFNRTIVFLTSQGHPSIRSQSGLKQLLKNLWFDTYSRRKSVQDSGAFEHVFVGEISRSRRKGKQPAGLHNWLRFYNLEQSSEVDYAGYITKRQNLAIITYSWKNLWQRIGGFMLGTSPAFDLAAYTVCFMYRQGQRPCKFHLNHCAVNIKNYVLERNGNKLIGTTYPEAAKASAACRRMSPP